MRNSPIFNSTTAATYSRVTKSFEDMGDCSGLGWAIRNFSWAIQRYGTTEEKAKLAQLRTRHREWSAYEKEHGKGSLLKQDHPQNIRLAEIMRKASEATNNDHRITAPRLA